MRFHVALLLAAAAAGCGSSGSVAGAPLPPTSLAVTQETGGFDQVVFRWTPPLQPVGGYEAEGRVGSGDWIRFGSEIPGDAIGGTIALDPSLPELVVLGFRLRSVRDGQVSAWSVEATFRRGLRPPGGATTSLVPEGIRIAWTNASSLATNVRVSRQVAGGDVVLADLGADATSHVDTAPPSGPVVYLVRATQGADASDPTTAFSSGYPPTPVRGLTAAAEAGGVRLRWTNPPLDATGIVVHRAGGLVAAFFDSPVSPVLLPGTSEYLDPAPPGTYVYQVELRLPAASPRAQVWAIANPIGSPPLESALVTLPEAVGVASDGRGRLALAVGMSLLPPSIGPQLVAFRGAGTPPDHDLGANHFWSTPPVVFDAADHPHAVVARPVAGVAPVAIVHAWHDGQAWREEEVTRRATIDFGSLRLACDAAGAVHVAWSAAGAPAAVEHARKGGTGWEQPEDLTALVAASAHVVDLAVDGQGAPAMLVATGGGLQLLWRAPQATGWSADAAPAGVSGTARLHATSAGIGVVQERCVPVPFSSPTGVIVDTEHTTAGWGPDATVGSYAQCLPIDFMGATSTGDGARTVLWAGPVSRLDLFVRDAGGVWSGITTGASVRGPSTAWFDAAGKLGFLAGSDAYVTAGGNATYIQYHEP